MIFSGGVSLKDNVKRWLTAALIRALRTFLQVFGGGFVVGAALSEIEWLRLASVAATSAIFSIVMSLATGLPEVDKVTGDSGGAKDVSGK